jgi:hypothetical protein
MEEVLKRKEQNEQEFMEGQITDFVETRPLGISPSKINFE